MRSRCPNPSLLANRDPLSSWICIGNSIKTLEGRQLSGASIPFNAEDEISTALCDAEYKALYMILDMKHYMIYTRNMLVHVNIVTERVTPLQRVIFKAEEENDFGAGGGGSSPSLTLSSFSMYCFPFLCLLFSFLTFFLCDGFSLMRLCDHENHSFMMKGKVSSYSQFWSSFSFSFHHLSFSYSP